MAAESVKIRNRDDFIEGEHVWVEAKYFDDLKCAPENLFSATCDKVYGVITSVASRTCKVVFKDGSTSYVAKDKLNLDGKACIVNTGNKDDEESENSGAEREEDYEDENWTPGEDGNSSKDQESEDEGTTDKERVYYLMKGALKLFVGKLISGAYVVHNVSLEGSQRKFEIIKLVDADKWDQYDQDRHSVGAFLAWDLKDTQLKVQPRRPESTLEQIIPPETLAAYKQHLNQGCEAECGGNVCKYSADKVDYRFMIHMGEAVVASIARKNPYLVETLKHGDIIDLKELKQNMKVTNVKKNKQGEKVKWNNEGSITWMRFEKHNPDTVKYKVDYSQESPFKQIKVIRRVRQNAVLRGDYSLPKAFTARLPVSKAKFDDLMELCKDLTIPSAHHEFYNNLLVRGHENDDESSDSLSEDSEEE